MNRLGLFLCSLVVLTLMAACAPSARADAFLNSIWGPIKFPPGQAGCPGPQRCSAIPTYQELGVEVFQYQLQWNRIAPTRPSNPRNPNDPAYHWSNEYQFAVEQGQAAGIEMMFMIKGSPPWANGGRSSKWAPNPADFADFAVAAARKFPSVHLWEIWGETNRAFGFLPQGEEGPRRYALLLDASYGALKGVSAANIVIGGMSLGGGPDVSRVPWWLKRLKLPGGKPPRMDWFGHNGFQASYPRLRKKPYKQFRGLSDVRLLWKEVKRIYQKRVKVKRCKRVGPRRVKRCRRRTRLRFIRKQGRPKKLWLSEWSIQSDHPSFVFSTYVSRAEQAAWLQAAYAALRPLPFVQGLGWYQLSDYPASADNPTWGLMTYEGQRKPAFNAYKSLP